MGGIQAQQKRGTRRGVGLIDEWLLYYYDDFVVTNFCITSTVDSTAAMYSSMRLAWVSIAIFCQCHFCQFMLGVCCGDTAGNVLQ